mmetsp:Transcript_313/g.1001  ORF Transcript_313/g.1001 Transcript_313/m.1001 type:complete len:294 (+) Transcript_313:1067-1948(+)
MTTVIEHKLDHAPATDALELSPSHPLTFLDRRAILLMARVAQQSLEVGELHVREQRHVAAVLLHQDWDETTAKRHEEERLETKVGQVLEVATTLVPTESHGATKRPEQLLVKLGQVFQVAFLVGCEHPGVRVDLRHDEVVDVEQLSQPLHWKVCLQRAVDPAQPCWVVRFQGSINRLGHQSDRREHSGDAAACARRGRHCDVRRGEVVEQKRHVAVAAVRRGRDVDNATGLVEGLLEGHVADHVRDGGLENVNIKQHLAFRPAWKQLAQDHDVRWKGRGQEHQESAEERITTA